VHDHLPNHSMQPTRNKPRAADACPLSLSSSGRQNPEVASCTPSAGQKEWSG
jgi:hypothetical protein